MQELKERNMKPFRQEKKDQKVICTYNPEQRTDRECALVFYFDGSERYTAGIFFPANGIYKVAIPQEKIEGARRVVVVDIEDDEIMYEEILETANKSGKPAEKTEYGKYSNSVFYIQQGSTSQENMNCVNRNYSLLESSFIRYDGIRYGNVLFYAIDENTVKEKKLTIIYHGIETKLTHPYLCYKENSKTHPSYIIGVRCRDDRPVFILGALGTQENQPFWGTSGFREFIGIEGTDRGYWILKISATSGRVLL